jgi:uncharacterized Zn-finger protein
MNVGKNNIQWKLLLEIQDKGFNVVTCGYCGQPFIHRTNGQPDIIGMRVRVWHKDIYPETTELLVMHEDCQEDEGVREILLPTDIKEDDVYFYAEQQVFNYAKKEKPLIELDETFKLLSVEEWIHNDNLVECPACETILEQCDCPDLFYERGEE